MPAEAIWQETAAALNQGMHLCMPRWAACQNFFAAAVSISGAVKEARRYRRHRPRSAAYISRARVETVFSPPCHQAAPEVYQPDRAHANVGRIIKTAALPADNRRRRNHIEQHRFAATHINCRRAHRMRD